MTSLEKLKSNPLKFADLVVEASELTDKKWSELKGKTVVTLVPVTKSQVQFPCVAQITSSEQQPFYVFVKNSKHWSIDLDTKSKGKASAQFFIFFIDYFLRDQEDIMAKDQYQLRPSGSLNPSECYYKPGWTEVSQTVGFKAMDTILYRRYLCSASSRIFESNDDGKSYDVHSQVAKKEPEKKEPEKQSYPLYPRINPDNQKIIQLSASVWELLA